MSGICPELDARLSAELDRYYFSTDGSGLNLDRREKHRVINALHRLWNIEEIACYGVGFATEDIRKVILDLMKPAHIRLALKTVDFNSGAAYSLWLGCAIFMFAKFDEDLQHEIRKGVLSRGYLPLVVAGFLSEVVITEKGRHISQRIKVNLSLKEKTQYDEKNLPITKNVLAKTKREVEEKLKALKETVQKPVVKTAADMPFGEFIDYWYRNFCELSIAATTRLKYENDIYKHIIPGIGKLPLAALKKSDLEKFYAEQMKSGNLDRNGVGDKKLSGAVIRSMHTRIKCALDQALKEGLVNRNEAIGCKLPPKKNKEIEVLSHEEIARLLIQAKEEGFYELILLGLATGMRRGELLGLKWDDINFTTGELSIRREYTTLGSDYIISTPKAKSSVRSVHLPQSVLNILGEYRKTINSDWVFPSPLDPTHPRSPTSCRSRLSDMLERAECNHIPFHGLRHIFSTMALENGLDIKTLSAVLGHSSAETTISVYSHVTGEMERNAAKKMDDAFGTPKPANSPVCDDNPDDGQTPEQETKHAEFTAKKSKKCKPGTGCISKVSKNTWQGKYTLRGKDGKREQHIVYAKSEEACERKLGEMIEKLKSNEITIA